jgi:hypothetical protein
VTVYTAAVSRSRSPRMIRSSDNAGETIGNSEHVGEDVVGKYLREQGQESGS